MESTEERQSNPSCLSSPRASHCAFPQWYFCNCYIRNNTHVGQELSPPTSTPSDLYFCPSKDGGNRFFFQKKRKKNQNIEHPSSLGYVFLAGLIHRLRNGDVIYYSSPGKPEIPAWNVEPLNPAQKKRREEPGVGLQHGF